MRFLVFAILLAALAGTAHACIDSASASTTGTLDVVECSGTFVLWLKTQQSTVGVISAGEDLAVQGEVLKLDASFNAPVVGSVVLNVFNQTYVSSVEPDATGTSKATFYVRIPDVDSGNIPFFVDGYVEKMICANSTINETLRLSSNGTIEVAGCSSFESGVLLRKMQGVSGRLARAEKTFYDTLELLNGSMPEPVARHLLASLKDFEDAKGSSRQFTYEHDSRKRCAYAKAAADWAERYAENAYSEASMAYALTQGPGAASLIGLYEIALFAGMASAAYLLSRMRFRQG